MKNRGAKVSKDHDSDDDQPDIKEEEKRQVKVLSNEEQQAIELENVPIIPDSEVSPAAYIFQHQEEQDDLNIYEEKSTKIKCPFCDAVSLSIVEYQPSLLGYLLVLLAMLLFGFLSLVLLPLLVSLTKQAIHRCAKCLNEVKSNSYFGYSSMDDKLLSLSLGKFGIIFTRRQLFYLVMVLTAMMAIYLFILVEEGHNHEIVPITTIAWTQYRTDCGFDAFAKNPRSAMMKFERNYFGRGVSWDGYVVRVNLNEDDPMSMAFHSGSILVKMDVDDREGAHGADIGLSLSEHMLQMYADEVGDLNRGDHIRFNSTMQSMGDAHHLHHLHTFHIEKLPGHRDVEAHAYSSGRYKVKIEPHDGKEHPETKQTAPAATSDAIESSVESEESVTDTGSDSEEEA